MQECDCVHHYDCKQPNNGITHAKCRKCGAEKEYPSWIHIPEIRHQITPRDTFGLVLGDIIGGRK